MWWVETRDADALPRRVMQSQMSTVLRLRNPDLKGCSTFWSISGVTVTFHPILQPAQGCIQGCLAFKLGTCEDPSLFFLVTVHPSDIQSSKLQIPCLQELHSGARNSRHFPCGTFARVGGGWKLPVFFFFFFLPDYPFCMSDRGEDNLVNNLQNCAFKMAVLFLSFEIGQCEIECQLTQQNSEGVTRLKKTKQKTKPSKFTQPPSHPGLR